jgi:O-6-methylguanine DNA methyltransferase
MTLIHGKFACGTFTATMDGETVMALRISPKPYRGTMTPAAKKIAAAMNAVMAGKKSPIKMDLAWASDFQQRIYKILQSIPPGEMLTYGEIAARAGSPGAARAVGTACASNRIAILIPCHRVTRADGQPCGYSWSDDPAQNKKHGYGFKQAIIGQEQTVSSKQ